MSRTRRVVHATPEKVWDVLADGWLYPLWVVGASRMREVEDHWPEEGARLHHSVGSWPMLIDDQTRVVESTPPSRLELRAGAWPAGEAQVVIHLEPQGDETLVTIDEDAVSGPGKLVPGLVRQPGLVWRNTETLRRLAYLAERRQQ